VSFIAAQSKEDVVETSAAMSRDETISALNELIETCKDGENGFRTCAENVKSASLKALFSKHAGECAASARELQTAVRGLGGDPDTTGSVAGAIHRGWLNVAAAVSGKDEATVIAECERGEDVAMAKYGSALKLNLPPDVKQIVARQYAGVKANHDEISALKRATKT
jgi:uncharacterized protein (TIGR02284 family)